MIHVLIVLIAIQQALLIGCQHIPFVPCPGIFEYMFDGRAWSAIITVPTPDVNKVVLTVNFIVGELNLPDNGKLNLNDKDNAVVNIKNNRPFTYTVILPKTRNLPQVTEITYNGNTLCVGPGLSPPSTTFWLTHTLNWYSSEIIFPNKPGISHIPQQQIYESPTLRPQPVLPPVQKPIFETSITNEIKKRNRYKNNLNCGVIRNKRYVDGPDVIPFIFNGSIIPRNNHPWLAAIYDIESGSPFFFCGGNLISNKHVLTAAHCTLNKKQIQVKVGAHNAQDFFDPGSFIKDVVKITNHEDYAVGSAHADISIILLADEVEFTAMVKPICLWNTGDDINRVINRVGTIMGWGLTEKGDQSSTPLQTEVTIASQQQCRSVDILRNSISDMTFCAGTKGTGPCMGDSGGGLFLERRGRWYLRGIISVSIANRRLKFCDVNTYAVYVDTAKYMDWIVDNIN